MTLELGHMLLLAFWGGLVAAETVVEIALRSDADQRLAACLHYWMDLLLEMPTLVGILATGTILLARVWPPSTLLTIKVGCGLGAIGLNLLCAILVILRYRQRDNAPELTRLGGLVRMTWVGLPLGLVALYIGLTYFL